MYAWNKVRAIPQWGQWAGNCDDLVLFGYSVYNLQCSARDRMSALGRRKATPRYPWQVRKRNRAEGSFSYVLPTWAGLYNNRTETQ